jgi:16S rRNA (cytosine1402-N4)-methyltransferase
MTMGSGGKPAVAGGLARHVPVLGPQVVEYLQPKDGGLYIDGTFGAGGYARAIIAAANTRVIGIDRDQQAIALAAGLVEQAGGRLQLAQERFSRLDDVAREFGHEAADGVVLDIGVSSMQLDDSERGFSFRLDGPLDMRMGGDGAAASEVIAKISERDLALVIRTLGEERHASAVARAIVKERDKAPIRTTRALADIVARVVRAKPGTIHPATRTFQALRIFINEELSELARALAAAERILKPAGRVVVVSFHSLEDRIVKTFFAERSRSSGVSRHRPPEQVPAPTFTLLTKKPLVPDDAEIEQNPRARSAKLRAAARTEAAARAGEIAKLLPQLPALADVVRVG